MAAFPTQFASVASLSAPASLLSSTGPKPSPGSPSGLDLAARSAAMPPSHLPPVSQGPYTSSAAAAAAAQYSPAAAGLLAYSRLAPGFTDTMYGASFPNPAGGLYGLGADPSALYVNPITGTPYDLKENAEIWRNLSQQATCFAYDPTGLYSYGYGGMDLSLAARRKNATKENTGTLKAWLQEHKKNPYPTKGEKIMLAIITKMTLTQVSTWFANARRRLKKENKMTWSPRNRTDEDGNKIDSDDDEESTKNDNNNETSQENKEPHEKDDDIDTGRDSAPLNVCVDDASDILSDSRSDQGEKDETERLFGGSLGLSPHHGSSHPGLSSSPLSVLSNSTSGSLTSPPTHHPSSCMGPDNSPQKPRIWSLADVATSNGNNNNPGSRSALPPLPQAMPQPAHLGPPKLPGATPSLNLNHPSDSFNPSFNTFRPWINGAGEYPPPPGAPQTAVGATSQPSTTSNANLLRPYPLTAPRPEVH